MSTEHTAPFFSTLPRRMDIPDEDYTRAEPCVAMADALSRSTNHSIYLIDYNRRNFLYVSPNPLFLCGRSPEEVRRKGYAFYFEVVPPDDMDRLLEINEAGFRFYYQLPVEKRLHCSIDYDFHICVTDRRTYLIHHKLTPVLLSPQGDIWLALCVVSLSPTPSSRTRPVQTATSTPSPPAIGRSGRNSSFQTVSATSCASPSWAFPMSG